MKIKNAFTFITVLALGALLAPLAAFASVSTTTASGMPSFSLIGVSNVVATRATVSVMYDSTGASYDYAHRPLIGISYTNLSTGETAISDMNFMSSGSETSRYTLYDLVPGTRYSYRAILKYGGMTYSTSDQTFTTKGGYVSTSTSSSSTTGSSSVVSTTGSGTTTVGGSTITASSASTNSISSTGSTNVLDVLPSFGTSSKSSTSSLSNKVFTAGSVHKNGVALLITDEQARVNRLDTVTYTIKYQNTRSTSLKDTEINIQLPKQYEFVKSSIDGDYNADQNVVTFSIGRVAPDTLKSFTMTARAIGDGNQEVDTTATLTYDGGSVSATDRTEYSSGSKSVLGASVFGAGFFPQTLGGWVLVIILIAVLVIVARRYMTAPVQPAQPQKTA
jgi:hypothetical protein